MKKLAATPKAIVEGQSRKGRTSRSKGSTFERSIAKVFESILGIEFVRTPLSGGFAKNKTSSDNFRGDIVPADITNDFKLHVECKNTKTWALPKWLKQAESDCPGHKIPVVIFHKHNTSDNYVTLRLIDFLALIHKNDVIEKKAGTE